MHLSSRIIFLSLCCLALSGCVSREQADEKLARACMAGVKVLLPEGTRTGDIKDRRFSPSPEGQNFRHVTLKAVEMDGYLENEVDYECVFEESFGFLKANFTASVYQVRFHDKVYGKSGNEIQGSFNDFLKLSDAMRKALYE